MLKSRFWKNFDWILLGVTVFLVVIGLLVIWSTSFKAISVTSSSDVVHQLIFAVGGLVLLIVAARTDYRTWAKLTPWLYGIMIVLLVMVLVVSHAVLGAQRWINLGFFQFQPSEFAKLVVIIVLAKFFADHYDQLERPKYLLISLAYVAVPVALVMRQPDLGTALVLMATWLGMALVSRVRKRYLAGLAVAGLLALPFIISHLKAYQRDRLNVFLNPQADPLGAGHNVIQSTITIGSGQVFGRGLAAGSQSQLNFLPQLAQHTDFIFAVLGEKMGFIGGVLLLLLFGVLLWRGLVVAYRAQDRFGLFLATGIVSMLVFHIFINVGMNMGIAPVTGIPLPFVSYGGTSLLVAMAAVGLLQSIAVRRKKLQFEG
ncbi:MAG TPA: rod shape-determining protein RodA [Candidatus Saccharimonadia bacterium]|nr:rod shape-determining protein RodA [Candidatus Saccharimonadia bacterium]